MEVYRELYFRGEPARLAATMDEIERRLTRGWSRDREIEKMLMTVGMAEGDSWGYCFRVDAVDRLPAASIFISERENEPGVLYVSNVSPREVGQLTYGEFNAVLEEFYGQFARPVALAMGVGVELTEDIADLRRWLSESAAKKLRSFSRSANKGTGGAHPLDRERWLDFVVTAHREGSHLDASTLRRWLIEVDGWYREHAERLAGEYEFGGEVLGFSTHHAVPV